MFSAVEHYPNHAPPALAQWPTAPNALGPLRERHALEICNSPHAKAITRRRSFDMGRRAAMKCALEQLSGPLSNLDTILSLSPYYPKLRALAFSHRPNQYREETCLSSTISIERDKLLMLGCTTIIGICDCESYSYEPSRRSNQDNGENFACSTTVTRSVGGLVHFSASKKALSHASSNPLRSTFMHAACSEGNEDSLRERGAMQRCNFERAPYRHVCKIGWESKNSE